ncbi:MAG TPA: BadF/BadG/BcrA/BcrD ATPase family protein [Candidatus Limnocylindrales bacterium]|jgi:N-acetylglucosamine kinase-like BadF-type ATPase
MIGVVAVDGGNSKVDLALIAEDGGLLAAVRGPTISHQAHGGMAAAGAALRRTVAAALARAGLVAPATGPLAQIAVFSVAGGDTPRDVRRLRTVFGRLGLAQQLIVVSDAYGPLRAATDDGIGAVVICGSGSNMLAIGRTGRIAAYPALGEIAGDWGGGGSLGPAALSAAIRGRDGRGPHTTLERLVPERLGYARPLDVTYALYRGRLTHEAIRELAPLVFEAAGDGDSVARFIADQQADEIVAMAVAALRRVRLLRAAVPVVLAGGVFRTTDPLFHARIRAGLGAAAPRAEIRLLSVPPLLGAALLGFDALGTGIPAVVARLRATLTEKAIAPMEAHS